MAKEQPEVPTAWAAHWAEEGAPLARVWVPAGAAAEPEGSKAAALEPAAMVAEVRGAATAAAATDPDSKEQGPTAEAVRAAVVMAAAGWAAARAA
eukprot:4799194-Prymnesium_polylepis.1